LPTFAGLPNLRPGPRVSGALPVLFDLPVLLRRQLVAVFLLLCFVRVLLPEASLLALHPHQHTEDEPTHQAAFGTAKGKALLSKQHKHCHEEQLFNAPFHPSAPVQLVAPQPRTVVGILKPFAASVWAEATEAQRCLRGPPAGV